ncbi:MAG TPA: prolyl oligopeptidase family serine peptidase, partial [Sphingomonas sp.]|nr:prolyl oligopeptidase family serine peptidase [Sphingomonas sp.]
ATTAAPALAQDAPKPPVAAKKPHQVKAPFGATREDEYYWLRDDTRKNEEMLAYLKAENAYADAVMAPTKPVQEALYNEIVGRIKQDDSTVPYLDNGYWYYTRFETGGNYPIVARRKGSMDAAEEVILNQPEMAKGANFFSIGGRQVSPDNRLLAYAEDKIGRRQYVLKVKDLTSGQTLSDEIPNAQPGFAWAGDNKTIFYIEKDPVTLLGKRVKAHVLGTPVSQDRLVYEEKDDTFSLGIGTTSSEKFICIYSGKTVSDEQRCAPVDNPATFTVIAPRERDFLYGADHVGDRWVIRTNWQAPNYRLMTVPDKATGAGKAAWKDIVPHSAEVFIEGVQPFDNYLAIEERSGGNKRLRLLGNDGKSSFVEADEPAYSMGLSTNAETATDWVRYTYNSLTTPATVIEANMKTGERKTLKVTPVPGYDKSKYVTERVWATARDGTKVPVSLVYAKGFRKDGTAPLFQYAYGSYGYSTDPGFSPMLPSLLDRGMVYAIAHIRGGQEMGRKWYDDGRMFNKKNSFTDFIDVTEYLVKQG